MVRRVIAGLIAVGLGLGIWALWPRADVTPTTSTQPPSVAGPTTTTRRAITTSTTLGGTTTTTPDSHVVETVEEAEEILRELWFGWFEGIYNQDEDRIREVVATDHQADLARDQFGVMEFLRAPQKFDISVSQSEILRSDTNCLVVWTTLTLSGFQTGTTEDVHVFRWLGHRWGFFSLWAYRDDLWETDCSAQLGSQS